jgi:hypothetical protein
MLIQKMPGSLANEDAASVAVRKRARGEMQDAPASDEVSGGGKVLDVYGIGKGTVKVIRCAAESVDLKFVGEEGVRDYSVLGGGSTVA